MANIKGKIEQVAESKTKTGKPKYGVRIGTIWYNGWGDAPDGIVKGLDVSIDFDTNDYGNNIKKIVPTEQSFAPASEIKTQAPTQTAATASKSDKEEYWNERDKSIVRQVCLKEACARTNALIEAKLIKDVEAVKASDKEFFAEFQKIVAAPVPKQLGPEANP